MCRAMVYGSRRYWDVTEEPLNVSLYFYSINTEKKNETYYITSLDCANIESIVFHKTPSMYRRKDCKCF